MKKSDLFWGLVLIAIGVLLTFDRLLGVSLWRMAGPLLLIGFGIWVLVQSQRPQPSREVDTSGSPDRA